MRILHVGDIHIHQGPNFDDTEKALQQVSSIAREATVDLVLIPGDVFDAKSQPAERALFGEFLRSLDCPCVICKGNHDQPGDLLVYNGYAGVQVFEQPDVVPFADLDLLVLPWPERAHLAARGFTGEGGLQAAQAALGDLIRTMAATRPQPDKPLVAMGHLSVCGALSSSGQPLVGREIQVVAEDLSELGATYVALNHIHKPQISAIGVQYAGSLTVQDFGEEDEEKGVVFVDTSIPRIEGRKIIHIYGRRWITIEARFEFESRYDEAKITDANVRFRYSCTEEQAHLFDHAAIERRFAAAHSLKIVPSITRAQRVRSAEVAEARTTQNKVIAWGQATGAEITPGILGKLQQLEGGR